MFNTSFAYAVISKENNCCFQVNKNNKPNWIRSILISIIIIIHGGRVCGMITPLTNTVRMCL